MVRFKSIDVIRILQWMCFCTVLLLCGIGQARAEGLIDIRLRAEAEVAGPAVHLSHIAAIEAPDGEVARRISRIRIDRAPLPGHTMLVHPSTVERRLRRYGIDASQYRIASTGPVKIKRSYVQVQPEKIRDAVASFIKENAPWNSEQMRVRRIRFTQPVIVPPGPMHMRINAPKHTDWIGAVPFTVQVMVGGQRAKRVTVPANIEVWSEVAVVTKPLGKYQPLETNAIRMERMDLARVPNNAILDMNQVLGRRTNRNIAPNSILRSDQVEIPPLVRRGDMVQVIAESPVLKISVKGIVRQDGGPGERVKVINMRSKKMVYALVIDQQTVKVDF